MKIGRFFTDIYIDACLYLIFLSYIILNFNPSAINIVVFIFTLTSLTFWLISRVQLGPSFSVIPEAKGVVTNGLYSRIRHPIYLFTFLSKIGIIFLLGNKYFYLLVPIIISIQFVRAKKEEKALAKKFGKQYTDYIAKTWL